MWRKGQGDVELDTVLEIGHANLAVMAIDDGLGDGQAQAANFFPTRLRDLEKSIEKMVDLVIGNRRAGIEDMDGDLLIRDIGPNLNLPSPPARICRRWRAGWPGRGGAAFHHRP